MDKITLGRTNVEVSALAYGTDLIGSKVNKEDSFVLFDTFREGGGTFLDTGNFYASWYEGCVGGESETTIGEWMKERGNRDEMQISTKLGFDYPGCDGGLSAEEIVRECEKSLKRLQTDRIDLYYSHRDDFDTPQEETMKAYDALIQSGKVRAIGASNLKGWRIAESNTIARMNGLNEYCAIEQRYTYFRPRHGADFGPQICINEDLKDYAEKHKITLVAYSILLQGAYTRDDKPVPGQFAGPEAGDRMEALLDVSEATGATENQIIIAWMRQSSPAVLPIIAGSKPEQVKENLGALSVTLTDEQMERLNTAGNPDVKKAWLR